MHAPVVISLLVVATTTAGARSPVRVHSACAETQVRVTWYDSSSTSTTKNASLSTCHRAAHPTVMTSSMTSYVGVTYYAN